MTKLDPYVERAIALSGAEAPAFQLFGSNSWPVEHSNMLADLWREGHSARLCADKINRAFATKYTRSAALGKLNRMGLLGTRPEASAPRRLAEGKIIKSGRKNPSQRPVRTTVLRPPRPPRAEPKPPPLVDASAAKPWLERKFGECAYPISGEGADTFSCCQPADPHGYCKAHAQAMFLPWTEKPERLVRMARGL